MSSPLLSVIVTTYTFDRLRDVQELLASLRAQAYPNMEIIFVGERTSELCSRVRAYGEEKGVPNLRVLFNDGPPGLSPARNLGIEQAQGDIVAFIDDDALAMPGWAEEAVRTYEDPSIIGVTGPALPLWEDPSMDWLPEEFHWIISCTGWAPWKEITDVRNAWGMNMCFRREAFSLCGLFDNRHGFHQGLFAEDNEFSMRVRAGTKRRIVYNPRVRVLHRVHKYRLSWRFIIERSYWLGHARQMLRKTYGSEAKGQLLASEYGLLKRILTQLIPETTLALPRRPPLAAKRLSLIALSLTFAGLGYIVGLSDSGTERSAVRRAEAG